MNHDELIEYLCTFPGDAHCFSAHVPGRGYVNRGETAEERPEYERQLERAKRSEAENMGWATKYRERGYRQRPKNGILFANWNVFPTGIDTALEKLGYAVEWSDEWATCEDCQGAFRTQPDGYGWEPSGDTSDDGATLCRKCRKHT